jgi:hypothetical protein
VYLGQPYPATEKNQRLQFDPGVEVDVKSILWARKENIEDSTYCAVSPCSDGTGKTSKQHGDLYGE